MKSRSTAPKVSEPKQHFESNNRYCFDDDDDEWSVCSTNTRLEGEVSPSHLRR